MVPLPQLLSLTLVVVMLSGCSTWRGMPTHGGGKRFDEEQRVVAGAVRRAVADMTLEELRGKNVQITVDALAHNGGGYFTMPGVQNISGSLGTGYSSNINEYDHDTPPPGYYGGSLDSISRSHSINKNYGASYQPSMSYGSSTMGTESDLTYLISALNMKARHHAINVVGANPEYMLFVLVDVLGTNRSRRDNLIFWRDTLTASCELTYYAVHVPTNHLQFTARQAMATGTYAEDSLIGFTAFHIVRELESEVPDFLPVDGSPTTVTLARAVQGTTETTAAALALGRSTSDQPADPAKIEFAEARLRDADLQMRLGDVAQAKRQLQAVRTLDPSFPGLSDRDTRMQRMLDDTRRVKADAAATPAKVVVKKDAPAVVVAKATDKK